MKSEILAGLLYRITALLARLPWSWRIRLADLIACVWLRIGARESRVAWRNLQLAYPELSSEERKHLHWKILRTSARQTLETLRLWSRPPARNLTLLSERHGETIYDAALAAGHGVIVAAPHFGNWELLNQWLASRGPITVVYRPPESPVGDAYLRRVRGIDNVQQVRAEGAAVRQLWKTLNAGGAIGILPDQQPKAGDGEFAPFFGTQALTMTLLSRLANRTRATVLMAWCEQIGIGPEFALHIEPAPPEIADPDRKIAVAALNRTIEQIVRRDPTQYQWTYKRYTLRPPNSGETNPYADL
ncbi:MAG: lauroyl acyltransferase [Xanthomonadaceae bacterium]|jgi:KDO2-lipid IV(A) lauroyltransferase|nr:lauroyl acyltransferase [Xanthomonadaceae bacterium]